MRYQGAAHRSLAVGSRNLTTPLGWFIIASALVLLSGCGEQRLRDKFGTLRSEEVPVGLARVAENATRQAHGRIAAGEAPAAVVEEGKERLASVARAFEIPAKSPIWKRLWEMVFSTAMQCNYEEELQRYDIAEGPDIPPKVLRGRSCIAGGTIPDPCSLAGYLMRAIP